VPVKPITASVGEKGANRADDVRLIQTMLNQAGGAGLKVDGVCGPNTIAAIRKFQSKFIPHPDGRIDPGGTTFHKLAGAAAKLILLPQRSGAGYYSYASADKQYGTEATIAAILDVAGTFRDNRPNLLLGIGDISLAAGGNLPPHVSHKDGRNVDIRPLRTDAKMLGVTFQNSSYSRENTRVLVESLLAHRNVRSILFNDTQIKGVTHWAGHDNHLHVNMHQ